MSGKLYLGYVTSALPQVQSVYCGRNNPTFKKQNIGLGNPKEVYQDAKNIEIEGKMTTWSSLHSTTWQDRYHSYLLSQYQNTSDLTVYHLLNQLACNYVSGIHQLLQCYCYKDIVEFPSSFCDHRCHTEIIADAVIKIAKKKVVFVYGTNKQGFSGAGSAGYAMFGSEGNHYQMNTLIPGTQYTLKNVPNGTQGLRAIKGEQYAKGLVEGSEGYGYGICTIERPGKVKSVSLEDIYGQLKTLLLYARQHGEYIFCMTPVGTGYSGWSPQQILTLWNKAIEEVGYTWNIYNIDCFQKKINVNYT